MTSKSVRFAPLPRSYKKSQQVHTRHKFPITSLRKSRQQLLTSSSTNPQQILPTTPQQNVDSSGDFPTHPKSPTQFRILFSNINGISTANFEQDCQLIGFRADAYHTDLLALVETNINWRNRQYLSQFKTIMRKYWTQTIINTSSHHTTSSHQYQPGGTMTLIGNQWTGGTCITQDPSDMG